MRGISEMSWVGGVIDIVVLFGKVRCNCLVSELARASFYRTRISAH